MFCTNEIVTLQDICRLKEEKYICSLSLLPFVFYFHCYDQCLRFLQIKQNGSKHKGALLTCTCLSVILDFQYLMV